MNKAFLIGRLGKDPTRVSDRVVAFDVATKAGKDKEPVWHRVKTFDKLADLCQNHLAKGRQVAVVGEINNFKYRGKDGKDVYGSEVVASQVEFLGDKPTEAADKPAVTLADVAPAMDDLAW